MRGLGPCDVDSISTTLTMKYKITDIRIHQNVKNADENLRDIVVRIDYTIDGEEDKFISKSIEFVEGTQVENIILHNIKLCFNAILYRIAVKEQEECGNSQLHY